jgi:alkaline phosphatase
MPSRRLSLALAVVILAGCSAAETPGASLAPTAAASPAPSVAATPAATASAAPTPAEPAILLAAGDIAACDETGDSATAALVEEFVADDPDATVAMLGDSVYPSGSAETYAECFESVWGPFLELTRPAIGNHEIIDDGGAAYFDYFGAAAGTPGEGWYSYDIGDWHVVVLNSNCDQVACTVDSPQVTWLRDDLASADAACVLAYWHHPRFSSGPHGSDSLVAPFWDALYEAGGDLVLAGHEHQYERFAPQSPAGEADAAGIRQITAGTGGKALRPAGEPVPNSEVIIDDAFGVLRLELEPDGYAWSFVTTDGIEADGGSDDCE